VPLGLHIFIKKNLYCHHKFSFLFCIHYIKIACSMSR